MDYELHFVQTRIAGRGRRVHGSMVGARRIPGSKTGRLWGSSGRFVETAIEWEKNELKWISGQIKIWYFCLRWSYKSCSSNERSHCFVRQ